MAKRNRWALAGLTLAIGAIALPALASGAGSVTNQSSYWAVPYMDGLYYNTYAPNPIVGPGAASMNHTRAYFDRPAYHFNGVGWMSVDSQTNRKLAYQISDTGGNYIYFVTNYTYEPFNPSGGQNVLQAGMWRSSGGTWHFNWWGPNLNVGVDAYNNQGHRGLQEAAVGADGWGGCPNSAEVNNIWGWIFRYQPNGSWYYWPTSYLYNAGSSPTWSIFGSVVNGGSITFGTTSCP